MDRIKRLARKALEAQGLRDLQYAYVVETKSRRGRSRTPLHLHGFFISNDPHDATRFKVGFEKTLATHTLGRAAAGVSLTSGPEIVLERVYDKPDGSDGGRGRWANYIAKNLNRWDARFTGVFTSLNRPLRLPEPSGASSETCRSSSSFVRAPALTRSVTDQKALAIHRAAGHPRIVPRRALSWPRMGVLRAVLERFPHELNRWGIPFSGSL